jgi:cytochrome d ubiquinol oxidase subunit I
MGVLMGHQLGGLVAVPPQRLGTDRLPRALLVAGSDDLRGLGGHVAGWYVTEIGRQPFIVYGLLRTAEVASTIQRAADRAHADAGRAVYAALVLAYVSC